LILITVVFFTSDNKLLICAFV